MLQKMVFPDGIEYDRKNDEYRTFRVNSFFSYILIISEDLEHKKTGFSRNKSRKSGSVPEAGIEPALQRNTNLSRARLPVPPLGH